jgi:hypothetical protein
MGEGAAIDQSLLDALVHLVEAAGQRDSATETLESWCHYDRDGLFAEVCERLLRDERIARNCHPGMMLWLATGGGSGFGLDWTVPSFIRAAEATGDLESEARRFLEFLRLARGRVGVEISTTLLGLKLPAGEPIELPFGRLRAAAPVEIAGLPRDRTPPPAGIFSFDGEVDAGVATAPIFDGPQGDAARDCARQAYDERMTRMLLALVLTQEAPIQEHLIVYRARYMESGQGINVPPLAAWVGDWPYSLESGPRVAKLREYSDLIAGIDVRRLAVPTRRYLLARAERIRPDDQIVDYATALEAITGGKKGAARAQSIGVLVGGSSAAAVDAAEAEARRIARARNSILHNGLVPDGAPAMAREARQLVLRAIEATVRRELLGSPAHPAWSNIHPRALGHVREWDPRRWHSGAAQVHSSQALCVSVFGALALSNARGAVIADVATAGGIQLTIARPEIACEEGSRPELLSEHGRRVTPTSVDVLITSPTAIVTIESKFLEVGFGACSQPPRKQCSGDFAPGSDLKTKTLAPCRLMGWDGDRSPRAYWDIAAALFRPDVLSPPQRPCPFAGPSFQLMRNICFAAALAQQRRRPNEYGFLVVYVAASPSAPAVRREFAAFTELLVDELQPRVGIISYEDIAAILRHNGDDDLACFIDERIPAGLASAGR